MRIEPSAELVILWKNADAVCLDVDSTVIVGEGLDELAEFCGFGKEVKEWTRRAMGEAISFRDTLHARLNIFKPSKKQVEACRTERPLQLTSGVRDLVNTLHRKKKAVYLISGGFHCFVDPVAEALNIPLDNVFANRLLHDKDGKLLGFDTNQPTSESGGKPAVVGLLKNKYNYERIVMIGDGMTDLEASPPADLFIGFGGNQVRENVRQNSLWYISDFQELTNLL